MVIAERIVKALGNAQNAAQTKNLRRRPRTHLGPSRSPVNHCFYWDISTRSGLGTLKKMPWREEKGRYWGPGILDMKAGVVMALAAVSVLQKLKISSSDVFAQQ